MIKLHDHGRQGIQILVLTIMIIGKIKFHEKFLQLKDYKQLIKLTKLKVGEMILTRQIVAL